MWLKKLFFPFVLLFLLLFGITTSTLVFAQKDTSSHVKPKVALVIDDFGQYNTEGVHEILTMGIPITCAIMPNLDNTDQHMLEAHKAGQQIIVHLPMEPLEGKKSWLGPGAITRDLSEKEIKELCEKDLSTISYAVGFNNHMGSAITTNPEIMELILKIAKEKNFFVLDSKTDSKSLIPQLASSMGVPWIQRDVFLDNEKELYYIKEQLNLLSKIASKKGTAVGIGHVGQGGKVTAQAIKEMIPTMKKQGIEFVYLSEIVLTQEVIQNKDRNKK